MSTLTQKRPYLSSSIGKKVLVALTGLFLVSFLIVHLLGNLLLLSSDGGAAFDAYSVFMTTSPFIKVAEIILAVGLFGHIYLALRVNWQNRRARPVGYKYKKDASTSAFSRYTVHTGLVVLVFLIIHLVDFWAAHKFGDLAATDFYERAVERFEWPLYSIFYIVSILLLSFHLGHGFHSAFQSLGLKVNKQVDRIVRVITYGLGYAICIGFAIIPAYFLLGMHN